MTPPPLDLPPFVPPIAESLARIPWGFSLERRNFGEWPKPSPVPHRHQ